MKKGFTLIELLAVIVILAIIALIASPIVINLIEDAKKSSIERSAEFYINAVNLKIANNVLKEELLEDGIYLINSSGNLVKDDNEYVVELDGKKPSNGSVVIENSKVFSSSLLMDNYSISLEDGQYSTTNNEVSIYTGTDNIAFNNTKTGTVSNYKIYGSSALGLPFGYTQVDYITIQNDGTNGYSNGIDTTVIYNSADKIEFTYKSTDNTSSLLFLSANNSVPYVSSIDGPIGPKGYTTASISPSDITRSQATDGTIRTFTLDFTTSSTSRIYFGSWSDAAFSRTIDWYSFKIWKNNTLLRNFVPCYRNIDNTVGMYDLVTNNFYKNKSTGTFIKGPNTVSPTLDNPMNLSSLGPNVTIKTVNNNFLPNLELNNYTYTNYNGKTQISVINTKNYLEKQTNIFHVTGYNNANSIDTSWLIISPLFDISPSTEYTLTFYARAVNNAIPQFFGNGIQTYTGITFNNYPYSTNITKISSNVNLTSDWTKVTSTFTSLSDAHKARITIGYDNPNLYGIDSYVEVSDIKLERGSDSTNYSKHFEKTTTIDATDSLKCIGTICDYIDYNEGKIIRKVGSITLTGDENFISQRSTTGGNNYYNNSNNAYYMYISGCSTNSSKKFLSNQLSFSSTKIWPYSITFEGLSAGTSDSRVFIRVNNSRVGVLATDTASQSATKFKQYLQKLYALKTPIIIYYELATPTETSITLPSISIPSSNSSMFINGAGRIELTY